MRYNEFESMIVPFINVRWWDIVYPYESLSVAIENGIQDIYNEYKWSWLINSSKLIESDWTDGNWYYWYDMWNIKSILALEKFDANWNYEWEFTEVKRITDLTDETFLVSGTYLIVSAPIIVTATYMKDYEWKLFNRDTSIEIPMPDKMIPALYYLVLSQIDIIEVTQADSQTYSNYWKYTNKIKTLKENDLPIATSLAWGNRY